MNGHSNIDTTQATEHLKNILNLNVEKTDPSAVIADSRLTTPNSKIKHSTKMETSSTTINYGSENIFQQVELSGDDINVPIYGTDVVVYSSPLHRSPSLKIMIDNVVDYGWDQKYYVGRLINIHLSLKYLAYSLKSPVSPCGFIRIMKVDSSLNLLIRGFKGSVKDLAFAFSPTKLILACIDESGHLFVFEIQDDGTKLDYEIILHIARQNDSPPSVYSRIVWCPYVPDDSESEDMTMQLCITYNEKAEIWRVDNIIEQYGNEILYDEMEMSSYLMITQHKKPITAAAFSPDGIALATASLDGNVKFFQLNIHENGNTPKYLHEWVPHNGKPLSSLFFLDDMKNSSPDVQFWKFAVTGADNNQELKLWSCKTWVCLQTISFKPNQDDAAQPCLNAIVDLSGKHLFLSDINRKVLYHLKVKQERDQTFICSLSEFAVKFSVLGLAILKVAQQKTKSATIAKSSCNNDDDDDEDDDDDDDKDEDSGDDECHELSGSLKKKCILDYVIRLYWIHTKSLQSCRIIYNVKTQSPIQSISSVGSSQDSFVYRDGLSDLIVDEQTDLNIIDGGHTPNKCISPNGISTVLTAQSPVVPTSLSSLHTNYQDCDSILLTPKDFTSPSHSDLPSVNITNSFTLASVDEVCSNLESDKLVSDQDGLPMQAVSPDINPCSRRKSSQHSSSSSPSREVAEILSPRQILNQNHESLIPSETKEDEILTNDAHPDTVICDLPPAIPFQSNEWPAAPPDPAKEYKAASASRSENDILVPKSVEQHDQSRCTLPPLEDGDISSRTIGNESFVQVPYLQRIEQNMEALNLKLTTISDTLHRQNQANQYIQSELQELRQQQKFTQNDIESFGSLDINIPKKLEQLISANAVAEYARIESLFNKRESNENQRIEQQSTALSQSLLSVISPQLDKIVKQEIQNTVAPQINTYVDTLVVHLQESLLQKVNATDNAIKDSVGKHLKSKVFGESIAQAVLNQFQQIVQMCCKDIFQTNVIPAFDKTCKMMIDQMNDIFVAGTTEYARLLEQQMKSTCENFEASVNKLQDQLKKLSVVADSAYEKQRMGLEKNSVENVNQNEVLISKIKQTMHEEVQKALKEQASSIISLSSRAATPASVESGLNPNVLLQLIKQGEMNEAFHQALCGYDLELVILLCQSVSLDDVFGPSPCPLGQNVLLALISQLSGDFSEKTELKIRFIEDAVASLDSNSEITKANFTRVFRVLEQRILAFMQRNPNHALIRNFRRVLLSSKSLIS